MSARDRSAKYTRWSAGPPSAPESPSTDVAPSTLAIMLSRTPGRSRATGTSLYAWLGSMGSTASGNSWRTALGAVDAQRVPAPPKERQGRSPLVGCVGELVHREDGAPEALGVPDVTCWRGIEPRGGDIEVGLRHG